MYCGAAVYSPVGSFVWEIFARVVVPPIVVDIGFHLGFVVLMASLKSRRTCSSRFRDWLSFCRIFSNSSGSFAASAALHNSLQFLGFLEPQ
jgi:hypothetical protein